MITITRKIQLNIVAPDKESLKEQFEKLYGWNRICHRGANTIVHHLWMQDNLKNWFYISEDTKVKLGDIKKDPDGILTTSRQNSTYQVLSAAYLAECPSAILTALNSTVSQTYRQEEKEVRQGIRQLRTYKRDIPIPVPRQAFRKVAKAEDGINYQFEIFGIRFKTWFGRDFSGNQWCMDQAMNGDYKWCDSSIAFRKGKLFLYAVFQFEKQEVALDPDIACVAELDITTPIKVTIGKKELTIGTAKEFLQRRLAIQAALRRTQKALTSNSGGHGRKKKLRPIDHFHLLENNYVETRIHQYTYKLVDLCVKNKCGRLILKNQEAKEAEAKQDEVYLLRNWGYFGMKEKLKYKCAKWGIELIVE